MTAATIAGALAQFALAAIVGWTAGNLALDRAFDGDERTHAWPERALAALCGIVLFSVVMMLLHIVTGGAVFGTPGVVPAIAVVFALWGWRRVAPPRAVPWLRVIAFCLLLGALYLGPAIAGGSSVRTGDPPWHLGWTEQLLDGEPVPTGPAPELGRNAYPWGLHAVLATMVRLVPGTTPLVAHETLHLLIVLSLPLAAACVARMVRKDAGWTAAAAMSFVGGFGWLAARGATFVTSPRNARFGADLVVASPNSVYELLPPGLPRELGLAVLAAAAVVVWMSANRPTGRGALAAGALAGLVGLISVPLFVSALLWVVIASVFVRERRLSWLVRVLGSALLVFLAWAGPVASLYVRHGGFVNITPRLGVEWPLPVALASWGLLLPAALAGAWWARKNGPLVVAFASATLVLLGLSLARAAFDWSLAGNATLLHQGRVWPPLHLLGAALAGIGAVTAFRRWDPPRWAASLAVTTIGLASVASPVLASVALAGVIDRGAAGFDYATEDMRPGSFLMRAARELDSGDVVDVSGPAPLAFRLFELSGARLATYDDPRLTGNDLRIRFADLAREWDRRVAAGGFDADYVVMPAPEGPMRDAVVRGPWGGDEWVMFRTSR